MVEFGHTNFSLQVKKSKLYNKKVQDSRQIYSFMAEFGT